MVIKIGIIGYGKHAGTIMGLLKKINDVKLEYIFHPTKNINSPLFTNKLNELYNCDIVMVLSPNTTHFYYLKKLIKNSNAYIFCEKPPVVTCNQIKYLKKIPNRKKHKIFFNFNFRFSKLNYYFKKYLESKKIGSPISVNLTSTHGFAFKREYLKSWRSDGKSNRHNILETMAIHFLDLVNLHLKDMTITNYIPSLQSKKGTSFDTCIINGSDKNNVYFSILNSYAAPRISNALTITGTNGILTIDNNFIKIYSPRNTFDRNGLFKHPPLLLKKKFNIDIDYRNSLRDSLNFFISSVKNCKKFDLDSFETSVNVNELIINLKQNHR